MPRAAGRCSIARLTTNRPITKALTRALTKALTRVRAKDKVKDKRAAPRFDPAVQFLFLSFATLNEGESQKAEGRRFSPLFAGGSGG